MSFKETSVECTLYQLCIVGVLEYAEYPAETNTQQPFLGMTDLLTGTQWTISLCTSITARRDSRKVEGSISERTLCLRSSPFVVLEDQSGKFAMMIEFVAAGIVLAMLSVTINHSKQNIVYQGFSTFQG